MDENNLDKEIVKTETPTEAVVVPAAPVFAQPAIGGRDTRDDRGPLRRNVRKPQNRREPRERVKPEFDQKIINIRRVTRVVTGGRRFSFSVAVVAGDRAGRVGIGLGKASDTPLAIDKAFRSAKKNMVRITMTKNHSIPHEVSAKYASSQVMIMRAPGKGVLAGSSVRTVLEFAGLKEVGAKLLSRSKNPLNNARAAIKALKTLKAVRDKGAKANTYASSNLEVQKEVK